MKNERMKLRLTIILAFIFSASSIIAKTAHPTCPSVGAIQARGLDVAIKNSNEWSVGVVNEPYDTGTNFTFAMTYIHAENEKVALEIGKAALKSLVFIQGPIKKNNYWICKYENAHQLPTEAWTPITRVYSK